MPADAAPLRMDPGRRRAQLLDVAADYIGAHGVGVSLDDIARTAGISPPLMRHYFTNRDGLLVALFERMIGDILEIWTAPAQADLADRLSRYLDWIARHAWAHRLWMVATTNESVLAPLVADARRRLIAAAGPRSDQAEAADRGQVFRAAAWVTVVESSVQDWLADGAPDRAGMVALLLDVAARLGIVETETARSVETIGGSRRGASPSRRRAVK